MSYGKVIHLLTTTALVMLFTLSCDLFEPDNQENEIDTPDTTIIKTSERPDGWEYASHDKDAGADYTTLFPDNKVNRIDITISDSLWKVLMEDMASMSGSFGAGGTKGGIPGNTGLKDTAGKGSTGTADPFSGQIPQELYDAAKDKQYGDSCSCTMMGMSISGNVDTTGGQTLL